MPPPAAAPVLMSWLPRLAVVLLSVFPTAASSASDTSGLTLERTIPLARVSGRIDHMTIDLQRKRLLVAELGNGTVDAVDLSNGTAIHRIDGLREPQGVGYAPRSDVIAVANAGDGAVRLFHGQDFAPLGAVHLGEDADNIRLDPAGNLVVGYGNGALAIIDPGSRTVVRRMKLPAHPEGFQLDPATRRAFVNLPDARQIAVVDLATGAQVATWPAHDLRANFPMARSDTGAILTVFRSPPRLVVFDQNTGARQASMQTCTDADDVFFDARRARIYISCGEGTVDIIQQDASGYRPLGQVKTASGARTSLFVPELDRLFVAARAGFFGFGSDAAILVFRPQP